MTSPKNAETITPASIDPRIANSLNTEPNRGAFEASKYEGPITPIKKGFPTVEKVLTYSNLKLDVP